MITIKNAQKIAEQHNPRIRFKTYLEYKTFYAFLPDDTGIASGGVDCVDKETGKYTCKHFTELPDETPEEINLCCLQKQRSTQASLVGEKTMSDITEQLCIDQQKHRFSDEQIAFMRSLGLNFDFDRLTDDEWCEIEETVGDRLCRSGFDEDYNVNSVGIMCESILDKLPTD